MTPTILTIEKVRNYQGQNSFIIKMKDTVSRYGGLTPKQLDAVIKIFDKEDSERMIYMNWATTGETIVIGRKIGQQLKEAYGLEFNPTLIDITRLLGVSSKSVKFSGKMTIKRGKVCLCCMRDLTDEYSMITNLGKTCAKHMRVPYIKDASEATRFREDYLKRIQEIGEMTFTIPKNQIKKWNGMTEHIVNSM